MVQWMDRNTGTPTHMGAEGANWIGQAPFTDESHIFANIGDGTFFHSGILAIRAAVASGVNITYKVLANDAVAMTGGQPVDGSLTVGDIVAQVRAEGVAAVRVVSDDPRRPPQGWLPCHGAGFTRRRAARTEGDTGLHGAGLRPDLRRRTAPPPQARPGRRSGCPPCDHQRRRLRRLRRLLGASNCVAVVPLETEFGVKRTINQTACNKDLPASTASAPPW